MYLTYAYHHALQQCHENHNNTQGTPHIHALKDLVPTTFPSAQQQHLIQQAFLEATDHQRYEIMPYLEQLYVISQYRSHPDHLKRYALYAGPQQKIMKWLEKEPPTSVCRLFTTHESPYQKDRSGHALIHLITIIPHHESLNTAYVRQAKRLLKGVSTGD